MTEAHRYQKVNSKMSVLKGLFGDIGKESVDCVQKKSLRKLHEVSEAKLGDPLDQTLKLMSVSCGTTLF